MSLTALLLGGLIGAAGVWLFLRRGRSPGVAPGVSPHLLPDPALEWLRRAHGATGVWVAEMDPREGEPHAERVVDAERLSVAQIVAVDRRLERARDQEQSGAERMEGGTLVFHAAAGIAVGLLLPGSSDASRLDVAESDLRRLADGVRRRPQIVQLAQAHTQEASLESVGSVGLRLAYQLERMLDAQVVVAGRAVSEQAASAAVIEPSRPTMLLAPFLLILSSRPGARTRSAGTAPAASPAPCRYCLPR